MFSAIFLDRDGVLIENRDDYIRDWSHVEFIPGAMEALSLPGLKNYRVVLVTNQSAVGRGLLTLDAACRINDRLLEHIHALGGRIDGLYMCPHVPEDGCQCRKPRPGLLLQASRELNLDLSASWMIGDAWSDVQAGQAAGVRQSILLRTGRGSQQVNLPPPGDLQGHLILDHLAAALEEIFIHDGIQFPDKKL